MTFPFGTAHRTDAKAASEEIYDVVIVGSGISGAIIAKQLSQAQKSVLIIEAGVGDDPTLSGYNDYLLRFYETAAKDNQSAYPLNANAPMPRSTDARKIVPGVPNTSGYLVQNGPFSTDTTYTRVLGGTTMHWEAKVLRMLPDDFEMRTRFDQGKDWPIKYRDLKRYYEMAEREIGVSGDASDQVYLDVATDSYCDLASDDYEFPMDGFPLSYLDTKVDAGIRGSEVNLDGKSYPLQVRSFPQGRNGIPNPRYNGGKGYVPVGAVSTNQTEKGGRCQGNNACVPICPIQAKYHAGKTLAKAMQTGKVRVLARTVACKIHFDDVGGRISHIEVKTYGDPASSEHTTSKVRGRIFVLCANAIENARLMLASALPNTSGLVGRNLMDHAYLLSWALMPMVCGTMRGTNCTGGITALRNGTFRRNQSAFSVDIHNDGWGWATGSPNSDLMRMVDDQNKFGAALRRDLADWVTRQLLLAFMIEVPPNPSNRVSVDPAYKDRLGNMRPVISYTIPLYVMRGVAYARQFARIMFQRLGAVDYTAYDPEDYGYVAYEGEGYIIRGGNHLAGTHVMGTNPTNSVVDSEQRSWDHENLYVVGGGSMPTIGTANVTNTIVALCFRSAEAMISELNRQPSPQTGAIHAA